MSQNKDENLWSHYQLANPEVFALSHDRHEQVYRSVRKFLAQKAKILEIGFGDGYLLKKLSKNYQCFGADISKTFVKKLQKNNKKIKFSVIGIDGRLPYDANFFDGYIASEVFEHMNDKELLIAIREAKRVLINGGYAFLTFPAEENLADNEFFCPECKVKFHRWGHKQSWNKPKINHLFCQFKIIKIEKLVITSANLNFFGRLDLWMRKIIVRAFDKNLSGLTYLVILKKEK